MSLIDYLPDDYKKSEPTQEVLNALGKLWDKVGGDIEDFQNQLCVETATWGLTLWEWVYNIETDLTKGYEIRRSVVRAQMRGAGTTTIALIKNTSESYVNGEVDVTEVNEESKFIITMVSVVGRPPNMDDLKRTLDQIKPAHLDYEIVFKYNCYADLTPYTYGQLKNTGYTHEQLRTMKLPPPEEVPM